MSRKNFLFAAAFFTLFTFLGHSFGTLVPHAPKTESLGQAFAVMESTMMDMPVGSPRSLAQLFYGGNVFISLYLLVSGIFFLMSAKTESDVSGLVLLNSASLAVCAVLSAIFFFPLPAVFTGLAAVFSFLATRRAN